MSKLNLNPDHQPVEVEFSARIWFLEDGNEFEVWSQAIERMDLDGRSVEEWVMEHLSECGDMQLREECKLPEEGNFQVVLRGTLRGWWDGWEIEEYDEEVSFRDILVEAIPDEYIAARWGSGATPHNQGEVADD